MRRGEKKIARGGVNRSRPCREEGENKIREYEGPKEKESDGKRKLTQGQTGGEKKGRMVAK